MGLRATLGSGKNGARKVSKARLMVHTFKPYPSWLFVLFSGNFWAGEGIENPLKFAPFEPVPNPGIKESVGAGRESKKT